MSKPDGGPAFPHDARDTGKKPSNGMTLRDYLAAAALQGLLSNIDIRTATAVQDACIDMWTIADTALKERDK